MNRFIIVDGLPYLFAADRAYAVRWDEEGFTVGAEVELTEAPAVTYSEVSIMAKCAECLNSIDAEQAEEPEADEEQAEQAEEPEVIDFDVMTVDGLKTYAEEKGIDLGVATKKADIIAVIKAAE